MWWRSIKKRKNKKEWKKNFLLLYIFCFFGSDILDKFDLNWFKVEYLKKTLWLLINRVIFFELFNSERMAKLTYNDYYSITDILKDEEATQFELQTFQNFKQKHFSKTENSDSISQGHLQFGLIGSWMCWIWCKEADLGLHFHKTVFVRMQLKKGTKLELPFWMTRVIHLMNIGEIEIPKTFSTRNLANLKGIQQLRTLNYPSFN